MDETKPRFDTVDQLQSLGSGSTRYLQKYDPNVLETFPNKFPDNDFTVEFSTAEFTSLCPKTGQPDFAKITIRYRPNKLCVESKSLKLYLGSFRNEGTFMETITNTILKDLVAKCDPRAMVVIGDFAPRGGIGLVVVARFTQAGGMLPPVIEAKEAARAQE